MRHALKRHAVDRHELVAASQRTIFGSGSLLEDGLDVDRQVAMGTVVSAHDGEAKALAATLQAHESHLSGVAVWKIKQIYIKVI